MKTRQLPSQRRLRELLDYNPENGQLTWRSRGVPTFDGRCAGKEAFTAQSDRGYKRGLISGVQYRAHRIIYKMVHGAEPEEIDHINGDRTDNRISNLRPSNRRENMRNMECHRKGRDLPCGVTESSGRFTAKTYVKGVRVYLGRFDSPEEASDAVEAAIRKPA